MLSPLASARPSGPAHLASQPRRTRVCFRGVPPCQRPAVQVVVRGSPDELPYYCEVRARNVARRKANEGTTWAVAHFLTPPSNCRLLHDSVRFASPRKGQS